MASQPTVRDLAVGPSGPGVEPGSAISAPASQSSHPEAASNSPPDDVVVPTASNARPDASTPVSDRRGNTPPTSQPASPDEALRIDTGMRNTPPSPIRRPPENGEGPQPMPATAVLGSSTTYESPTISRPQASAHFSITQRRPTEIDWIIPHEAKRESKQKTLEERIEPTILAAREERIRSEAKAKISGFALNAAIGSQVVLGAFTTGLSVSLSGKQGSVATAVLGGLSTIVASYLARQRGSKEPELSTMRCKDLDQFLRECDIFVLDYGHLTSMEHDSKLEKLRTRFEELLGNANGERRMAAV
ncbi:hypothetical protein GGX14DRAFT_454718 [Mycena pura]|uniref:SMODS and SLOG-associating 2TM effector domain-containing protein n=1 Tax=Mycena pura TaxID=153505 RepID=A0AAD6VD18_9AGAR|nr:hypothetical protein GGX14DRAFT_454718 [Mycena pura]